MHTLSLLQKTFLIACLMLSGCTMLRYSDQLLTLQAVSDNQGEIQEYLDLQKDGFNRLSNALKAGHVAEGTAKKDIIDTYGEPVLSNRENQNADHAETLLYRLPTDYFNSERIYLYFDNSETLRGWRIIPSQ